MSSETNRYISMLPTVHNLSSFGYDARIFGYSEKQAKSWSWLLDPCAHGRIISLEDHSDKYGRRFAAGDAAIIA